MKNKKPDTGEIRISASQSCDEVRCRETLGNHLALKTYLSVEFAKKGAAAVPADSALVAHLSNAKLLRLPAVSKRVTMQRTAIYELIKRGRFPAPVKIGSTSAWVDLEVTNWIAQRMAVRPTLGVKA